MNEKCIFSPERIRYIWDGSKVSMTPIYKEEVMRNWSHELMSGKTYINGKIYTIANFEIFSESIQINVQETDFAHYLYSRKHTVNNLSCRSIAANALLVTNDNYLILGKMSKYTSLADQIKFIGGSIAETDCIKGHFNPCLSVFREVYEETGIDLNSRGIIKSNKLAAFITRQEFSFLNNLYLIELNMTKNEIYDKYIEHSKEAFTKEEIELQELVFIKNSYEDVSRLLYNPDIKVVEYVKEFFEVFYGKKLIGNIREYMKSNKWF